MIVIYCLFIIITIDDQSIARVGRFDNDKYYQRINYKYKQSIVINYSISMQEYTTLATRKPKFTNAQPRKFFTNHYEICLNSQNSTLYQYAFTTSPKIAADSTRKLGFIIGKAWTELTAKIGIIAVRGQNIYGKIGSNITLTVLSKVIEKDELVTYQITIKKTKEISLKDMIVSADYDENRFALQVINIDTKNRLLHAGLEELDRGKYFKKQQHEKKNIVENGFNGFFISRGYNFSSNLLRIGLCLHVDIFSRVIRQRSVLQQMQALSSKDQIISLMTNAIVITRYGTFKSYKVTEVSFNLSPLSTFTPQNTETPVSFEQYYLKHYNVNISIKNQPLLQVVLRTETKMHKGGKKQKLQFKGHLVPELVSLVGLGSEHLSNRLLMKQFSSRIQLTVDQRITETDNIIKLVNQNKNGIYQIGNAKIVEGYQLNQPIIQMKREIIPVNGQIKLQKQLVKEPGQFKNWYFVVHQNHIDQAKELEKALRIASKTYGITIQQSTFYEMKQTKPEFWSEDIIQQFQYLKQQNYAIPQIVMVLLGGPLKDNIYNEIKNLCTHKLKVCSQFAMASKVVSLNKRNQLLSYATNLIFQMNCKIGKPVWQVPIKNPNLNKKVIATIAIAMSKKGFKYTLGFVGTINSKLTKVYNQSKTRKRRQDFTSAQIKSIFINWIRVFFQFNNRKFLPEVIVLYREGLSDCQAYKNVQIQLQGLQQALVQARIKTKQPNYNPQIVYMSLNKRSFKRFYQPLRSGAQQKFTPKYINPPSGSIIVDEFRPTVEKRSYSKSQKSNENINPALPIRKCSMILSCLNPTESSCPTEVTFQYHNPRRTPSEAFIELTYEQCFNYYNWKGAVKMPACLQNADKLAKQACASYKEDINFQNQLSKSLHFL